MKKTLFILFRIASILIVVTIAWTLRARAVNLLPIDYDEDDYLRAGQEYTQLMRTSDWRGFLDTNYRPEHPPLAKIIFGVSILSASERPLTPDRSTTSSPDQTLPLELVRPARAVNAAFGILTVALLSLVNPLGGLFLAFHTFTIKYVSQIMLEALPALTSLITVLAYLQSKKQKTKTGWLAVSAIFLGLTAASKYLFCVVAIAILVDWFLDAQRSNDLSRYYRQAALWGILAVAVFFVANPYLWPDPLGRLGESVFYHAGYSSGAEEVQRANFPLWQPFVWLTMSPVSWHEDVFVIAPDFFIAVLAAFGLGRLWVKERVYVLWLGIAIFFLLLWPTKWPQYIVILTAPLSLAAAEGTRGIWESFLEWWRSRKDRPTVAYNKIQVRRALPWLIPGLIAFSLLALFPLLFQFAVAQVDLNDGNLRDGLQGGIWREFWGGITGQISATESVEDGKVHFTGLPIIPGVFNWINSMGLPFFNTMWAVLSVALQTVLGVGAALLLWQRAVKFRRVWQMLFILPWAIPEAIGAMLWLNVFAPISGWLSLAVEKYGKGVPFSFLMGWERNPNLILLVLLIAALWYGFPFIMLAASAGLKLLPQDVFDAASIDGATGWQTFRYVTWPLLMPLVVPAIIIRAIFAFNQFYLFQMFYFMSDEFGTFTLARLSYAAIYDWRWFTGSAVINIITILFLVGFIILLNRWSKTGEGVTYA